MINTIIEAEFNDKGQLIALKGKCKSKDLKRFRR